MSETTGEAGERLARLARLAPGLAAALALALFVWRSAPGVTFEDSGELAAATATLGVPHAPGYPLQMMLGRVWLAVSSPFVEDAARALNLFSAVCSAAAVGLFAALFVRVRAGFGAALAAAGLLATSTTFAAQAVVCEVYALNALLLVALLMTTFTAAHPLFKSSVLLGLAACAHPGAVLFAPLLVVAWVREPAPDGRRAVPRVLRGLSGFALGLAPYLYVPLAAAGEPTVNVGGIDSLSRLVDHLLRVQYSGLDLPLSMQAPFLFEQLVGQWPLVVLVSALAMAAFHRHVPRGLFAPLTLTVVVTGTGLLFAVGFPLDQESVRWRVAGSFVPLVVAMTALCSLGIVAIDRALAARVPELGRAIALPLVTVVLALALGPRTLATSVDQREATWAEDYAREVLAACPPNAILVISAVGYSDVLTFPLLYLQVVHDERPDVLLLNRELLSSPWYCEQLAERHSDLQPACAALARAFAERKGALLSPRDRRVLTAELFPHVYAVGRPVAFVTKPGLRVLAGRAAMPGPVLWHVGEGAPLSPAPPAAPWLPAHDPDPWIADLRVRTRERELARAALLERSGDGEAAARLRQRWVY